MVHYAAPKRLKINPEIIDRLLIVGSIPVSSRAANYAQEICQVGSGPTRGGRIFFTESTLFHSLTCPIRSMH